MTIETSKITTTATMLELLKGGACKVTSEEVEQKVCKGLSALEDKATAVKRANDTKTNGEAAEKLNICKETIHDILKNCFPPPSSGNAFSPNSTKGG